MIHEMDQKLERWVTSIAGDVEVVFDRPRDEAVAKPTVSVYLLELDNALPTQRSARRPLEISLRYLVTTAAPDSSQAHKLLSSLVFAALERPDLQVDLKPLAPELWAAFRAAPRPALVLSQPLTYERPSHVARVRKPAEIEVRPAQALTGVVRTVDGIAVPNAVVELPALNVSVRTDAAGAFDLGLVPGRVRDGGMLRILADGLEQAVPLAHRESGPLLIQFDPKEI